MKNEPQVSVCMITYNHEAFIRDAIEGVLKQKTDFPIELVIGEDCSSDRTKEICLEYQKNNPEAIRILSREKNLGMIPNFVDTLRNCKGKYIALCEGDDYWTDSLKLQKQVDFLEANPDFAICFHPVEVIYEDGSRKSEISNQNQKEITSFEDLASGNYIHTLSCVFRNNLFGNFPEWFATSPIGDHPLHLLNAKHGKVKFLKEVMGIYRVHTGGVWSALKQEEINDQLKIVFENCYRHFYPRGRKQFEQIFADWHKAAAFRAFEESDYKLFRSYYFKHIRLLKNINIRSFFALTIRLFLGFIPPVADLYRKFFARNLIE